MHKILFLIILLVEEILTTTKRMEVFSENKEIHNNFGVGVSISGNFAVIGSPWEEDETENEAGEKGVGGRAYVFLRQDSHWKQIGTLFSNSTEKGDDFGASVSVSGNRTVVGAPIHNLTGAVFVFCFGADDQSPVPWIKQTYKLVPEDAEAGDQFGIDVSLSGNTLLVGSLFSASTESQMQVGSAYVFSFDGSTWTQSAKLLPSYSTLFDGFGTAVSISNSVAIVGAPQCDENGVDSGAAFIFELTDSVWTQSAMLLPNDSESGDHFGNSVSVSGNLALVGAPWNDEVGAVYVFSRVGSSWVQTHKILPGDSVDFFGVTVSINGRYAVIGAYEIRPDSSLSGCAFIFHFVNDNWILVSRMPKITDDDDDDFSYSHLHDISLYEGVDLVDGPFEFKRLDQKLEDD
ncbi:hypothetical protein M0811_01199 [Anaeramoeba ignava]|uniref:Uncharacterized protein n=1 Tax=Anaeramoeba ignava TaxID=1746090 RepID=A0A9Q0LKP1_ANAIG|nr:hypothetical protein M0811_01199 [Anaeramoeba ignava]